MLERKVVKITRKERKCKQVVDIDNDCNSINIDTL